jgi:hypothetical protein
MPLAVARLRRARLRRARLRGARLRRARLRRARPARELAYSQWAAPMCGDPASMRRTSSTLYPSRRATALGGRARRLC